MTDPILTQEVYGPDSLGQAKSATDSAKGGAERARPDTSLVVDTVGEITLPDGSKAFGAILAVPVNAGLEQARAAIREARKYWGGRVTLCDAKAPDMEAALLAAERVADASDALTALQEDTSPFASEFQCARIELTEERFRAALAAYRAATKGGE